MTSEDGENFVKNLAQFVRTHEKALANALQLRRQPARHSGSKTGPALPSTQIKPTPSPLQSSTASGALAAALSLGGSFSFTSHSIKTAKLTLTPHHLFYLLSRFEDLGVEVGPLNVRVENLHSENSPANYVSFLSQPPKSRGRSDRDSVHSVSSVRSVMSNISSFWPSFGLGSSGTKGMKAQAQLQTDLKYLYSAFTMIPCLRLSPDRKARLIRGYEEFPFDTAVPLVAFKNVSALEICDLDFRSFYGWDKLADQLRSLTIKRGQLDDLLDLFVYIVLDDMDKRRRRSSSKTQPTPPSLWQSPGPQLRSLDLTKLTTPPASPAVDDVRFGHSASPRNVHYLRGDSDITVGRSPRHSRNKSISPARTPNNRPGSSYHHGRGNSDRMKRSGSGSSNSSTQSLAITPTTSRNRSSSNLLSMGILPASKWRFLRSLSIADNGLTELTASGLSPLSNTLVSLDLSSNLFTEVPDCLAMLTALRALNLSNCMIRSLHSLARNPLPAITALNLRANRLISIAGIERLLSLERLDIRDNRILDPTEMARLTGIPEIREIWVDSNPFVKSHSSYRTTIFDLFRATPGYTEDIIIDNSGPGYSERRQLRERVAETQPSFVKASSLEFDTPLVTNRMSAQPVLNGHPLLGARPMPLASQSEMAIGSSRRRKAPKRRIIDLSADEMQNQNEMNVDLDDCENPHGSVCRVPKSTEYKDFNISEAPGLSPVQDVVSPSKKTRRDDSFERVSETNSKDSSAPTQQKETESPSSPLADSLSQLQLGGDAYRQKIQALKDQFGSSWLRMLGEDGWQIRDEIDLRNQSYISATGAVLHQDLSTMRAPSQPIISGSRTLG